MTKLLLLLGLLAASLVAAQQCNNLIAYYSMDDPLNPGYNYAPNAPAVSHLQVLLDGGNLATVGANPRIYEHSRNCVSNGCSYFFYTHMATNPPGAAYTGLPAGDVPHTISAFFRVNNVPTTPASEAHGIIYWGNPLQSAANAIRTGPCNTLMNYYFNEDNVYTSANASALNFCDDNWHHVLVSYQPGVGRLLVIDGKYKATKAAGVSIASNVNFAIGVSGAGGEWFRGHIDEVAIWNTALRVNGDWDWSRIRYLSKGVSPLTLSTCAPAATVDVGARKATSALTAEQICEQVGIHSGCSGCNHGTKGACVFIGIPTASGVSFGCASKAQAEGLFNAGYAEDAGFLCPADPLQEPAVRTRIAGRRLPEFVRSLTVKRASTVFSKANDDGLLEFPRNPWIIDRTATRDNPYMMTPSASALYPRLTCEMLNSKDLLQDPSAILFGNLNSAHNEYCAKLYLQLHATKLCPEYGKAVSGICQSLRDRIDENCLNPVRANFGRAHDGSSFDPWTDGHFPAPSILPQRLDFTMATVPDGTAYCLDEFSIKPSGLFEQWAGFRHSFDSKEGWDSIHVFNEPVVYMDD